MKRILILILLAGSAMTTMAQKFGHIDAQALMAIVPGAAEANTEYEQVVKQHQAVLDQLINDFNTKKQAFEANPPQTEIQQQLAYQELENLQIAQQEYSQTAQQDLAETEQRLMQPLIDKAKKAIEDVGAENGFTYIFDSSVGVLLYDGGGEDVMPMVKAKLGIVEAVGE